MNDELPPKIEISEAFKEEVKYLDSLAPTEDDLKRSFSDEYTTITTDVRGNQRIDYNNIPIKNADGTPNKNAKILIEMHETRGKAAVHLDEKIKSGDLKDKPLHTNEIEIKHPLSASELDRIAKTYKLEKICSNNGRWNGRSIFDETGLHNLFFAGNRVVRVALVGTRSAYRVEIYNI